MQQAIEDLQRIQASTAQQVSGFKAELQSLREEVCGSVGECQMSVTEALHRHVEAQLQSVTADQEAVSATKWAACEKAVEEVRRRTERHMAELQASVREGNQRQAELKERVNFHENLIMEEQHGSRNAAVAMSTSERLDSVLVQVQEMDSDIKAVRALREEVGRMKRDQQELLGRQEDRGEQWWIVAFQSSGMNFWWIMNEWLCSLSDDSTHLQVCNLEVESLKTHRQCMECY